MILLVCLKVSSFEDILKRLATSSSHLPTYVIGLIMPPLISHEVIKDIIIWNFSVSLVH